MENLFLETVSPLSQFEIREILSVEFDLVSGGGRIDFLSTIGLYLTISSMFIILMCGSSINLNKITSNNWSISQELLKATVLKIVVNQINGADGQRYFPFIYTLFVFILVNNLIGLVPYSFASTSHFILTLSLSFTIVLGSTIMGIINNGLKFFSLFVPAGCPLALLPLLVLIEFISYCARCFSLGLRLGANIMSGHLLLTILSGFTYQIMTIGFVYFIAGLFPLAFIIAFSALELAIAFIQSIVFIILTCTYLKDGLDLHGDDTPKSRTSK